MNFASLFLDNTTIALQ